MKLVVKRKTQQQNTHKRPLCPAGPHTTDSASAQRSIRGTAARPETPSGDSGNCAIDPRTSLTYSDVTGMGGSPLA